MAIIHQIVWQNIRYWVEISLVNMDIGLSICSIDVVNSLKYIISLFVGWKSHIWPLHTVPWCEGCHQGCRRGDRKGYSKSRSSKEKGNDDTTLLSGIFRGELDTCNSTSWYWEVSRPSLCLFPNVIGPMVPLNLSHSWKLILFFHLWIGQICCWCICNILYREVGSGEPKWSHAKLLLGVSSRE